MGFAFPEQPLNKLNVIGQNFKNMIIRIDEVYSELNTLKEIVNTKATIGALSGKYFTDDEIEITKQKEKIIQMISNIDKPTIRLIILVEDEQIFSKLEGFGMIVYKLKAVPICIMETRNETDLIEKIAQTEGVISVESEEVIVRLMS